MSGYDPMEVLAKAERAHARNQAKVLAMLPPTELQALVCRLIDEAELSRDLARRLLAAGHMAEFLKSTSLSQARIRRALHIAYAHQQCSPVALKNGLEDVRKFYPPLRATDLEVRRSAEFEKLLKGKKPRAKRA